MFDNISQLDKYIYFTLVTLLTPQIQKIVNIFIEKFNTNFDTFLNKIVNFFQEKKQMKYCVRIDSIWNYNKSGGIYTTMVNTDYYNTVCVQLSYYITDFKENVVYNDKYNLNKHQYGFQVGNLKETVCLADNENITLDNKILLIKDKTTTMYSDGAIQTVVCSLKLHSDI